MARKNRYLLDSDLLISHFRGNNKATQQLLHYLLNEDCAVSAVTYLEVAIGEYRKDPRIARTIAPLFSNLPVISFTETMAVKAARMQVKLLDNNRQMGIPDLQIGSTAVDEKRVLVTQNVNHFSLFTGLKFADWSK